MSLQGSAAHVSTSPLPPPQCRYCGDELSDFAAPDFCGQHDGMARYCLACGDPLEADEIAICARCTE